MRQLVAKVLSSQGHSQSQISGMLGTTQASVSLYLSSKAEKAYSALATLALGRDDVDRYAALLAEDVKRSSVEAVSTLGSIWRSLLGRGLVCEAHRRLHPSLAQCDVCIKEYGESDGDRSGAIAQVKDAVSVLESSKAFVAVMPEVSVNIAYAPEDSRTPDDVVAVPGRIVKVKRAAKAMLPPEFGASRHMAKVLLLVKARRQDVRATVNLRYDGKVKAVLRKLGLRTLDIGGYRQSGPGDGAVEALKRRLSGARGDFDAVIDSGGMGVEPNVYLFGASPASVADLAVKVARLYSSR